MKTITALFALALAGPAIGQADSAACLTDQQRRELLERMQRVASDDELMTRAAESGASKKAMAEASAAHAECTAKQGDDDICGGKAVMLQVAEGRFNMASRGLERRVLQVKARAEQMRREYPACP